MAVIKKYQNNFTAGALTPGAYARKDLQKYSSGCKRIVNGIVHAHGGVSRRPGTLFVDSFSKGPCVLIPFVYSVGQAYVLAFYSPTPDGKAEMRIYKEGGVVVGDDGEVVTVETPYLPSELAKIKFTQSADTLFLVHPAHPPMRLIRYGHARWEFAELKFMPDIPAPTGLTAEATGFKDNTNTYQETTTYYKVSAVSDRQVESIPTFAEEAKTLSTWPQGARVKLTWDRVIGADHYEVYKNARGYYAWIGSAEKTEFTDDNIEGDANLGPKENKDPFHSASFKYLKIGPAGALGATLEKKDYEVRLASISQSGVESPSVTILSNYNLDRRYQRIVAYVSPDVDTMRVYTREIGTDVWEYVDFWIPWDVVHKPFTEGENGVENVTDAAGNPEGEYRTLLAFYTSYCTQENIPWREGTPLDDTASCYPGAVGIYQQRLIFGRSDAEPHTVWMSETGAFDSMAIANPLRDDSAITATVDSRQMNEIRHFVPLQDVLMLTSGAEFRLSAGSNADAITPTTINFKPQSYWGSNDVPPIVAGNNILFVTNSGKGVRDMKYNLADNGYSGEDVSILAEHLLTHPIVDWAYQQAPWNTIWICLSNGKLLTFTYMKEQEVWAWSEHESSGGLFRAVSCIREGEFDHVYYIVERFGQNYVEYQQLREYGDPLEDAVFVDCGISDYREHPTETYVSGLEHLAKDLGSNQTKPVAVVADGRVLPNCEVTNTGFVDLGASYHRVTIGLPYRTLVETTDPEINAQDGTTLGQRKALVRATFQLRETLGLKVGPTEDRMVSLKFPNKELYSGILETVVDGVSRDEATIVFVQDDPLPMTVLSVASTISVG